METEQEAGWFLRGFAQEMRFCPGRGAGRITECKARSRRPRVGSFWVTAILCPLVILCPSLYFLCQVPGLSCCPKENHRGRRGPRQRAGGCSELAEGPVSMDQSNLELKSGEDLVTVSPKTSPETPSI